MNLYHGDCLEVMRSLPDASVDAVITDPPYGTTACKWDAVVPFAPMWEQLLRIAKPNAAILLHASQPFTSALVMSQPKLWRHEWVWIKDKGSNFANTVREPMKEHDSVQVFGRGKWTYNRQMQERTGGGVARVGGKMTLTTTTDNYRPADNPFRPREIAALPELRVPSSWQRFNRETGLHPTQKPVALAAYLVRTYTNPGETVLDFTMGSGTTGVACQQEGRGFIGIELDAGYFAIASERIGATIRKEG